MTCITLSQDILESLDISAVRDFLEPILKSGQVLDFEQTLEFKIDFPRTDTDPRELSEIPEVRLWFIRLDSVYPWIPFFLNWKEGELARYTAMLIPHQFNRNEGIKYNSEALEIFVMQKVFILNDWLKHQQVATSSRLKNLTQMLGYEIEDAFFEMV
jgi:hypothetical protein